MAQVLRRCGDHPEAMELDTTRRPSQEALLRRVAELELQLQRRDEELLAERERSSKARKKARQLLAKLAERDEALAELKAALENVRAAASAAAPAAASVSSSGGAARALGSRISRQSSAVGPDDGRRLSRKHSTVSTAVNSPRSTVEAQGQGAVAGRELAVRKRTELVAQLEGHLAQMRANLAESEREVRELEDRKLAKEAEWNRLPEVARSVDNFHAHHAALAMISHQVLEKKGFVEELGRKTVELEEQVVKQRSLIEDLCHHSGGSSNSERDTCRVEGVSRNGPPEPRRDQHVVPSDAGKVSDSAATCEDEALTAFLAAAGPTADVVLKHPSLRAAFEASPPQLSGGALDGCSAEQRSHVLSLFTAWVAVSGVSPRAMRMCDISLTPADVSELRNTLEACSAQLDEWEMTRCLASDSTVRLLFDGMATQPLAHLNLSYNTWGPTGASVLAGVMPAWSSRLSSLILEMNGLGDRGCKEVASVLEKLYMPNLRSLELGWNELTVACAPMLARLLSHCSGPLGQSSSGEAPSALPRLQKLGLGGNGLRSEGAETIIMAALSFPSRALELDLSMNHIGSQPLRALCEWAEARVSCDLKISVNLEWNIVDDARAVWRLAQAMAGKAGPGAEACVRLANNELIEELDPPAVQQASGGLVTL